MHHKQNIPAGFKTSANTLQGRQRKDLPEHINKNPINFTINWLSSVTDASEAKTGTLKEH